MNTIKQCVLAVAKAAAYFFMLFVSLDLVIAANIRFLPDVPWAVPLAFVIVVAFSRSIGARWSRYGIGPAVLLRPRILGYVASATVVGLALLVIPAVWAGIHALPPRVAHGASPSLVLGVALTWPALAAIYEETVFRGILQGDLEVALSSRLAILITTGIFVGAHIPSHMFWHTLGMLVALGATAGFVASRTRSIWPGMLIHGAINLCVGMPVAYYNGLNLQGLPKGMMTLAMIAASCGLIGCIVCLPRQSEFSGARSC